MPRSNRPRRSGSAGGARSGARRSAGAQPAPGGAAGRDADDADLESRLLYGGGRLEQHPDGAWRVRPVAGAGATKSYLCPGCRQQIPAGTPHLVAWPAEQLGAFGGPGDRRHWHAPCWTARARRH